MGPVMREILFLSFTTVIFYIGYFLGKVRKEKEFILGPVKKFGILECFQDVITEREAEIAFRVYAADVGIEKAIANIKYGFYPGGYFEGSKEGSRAWKAVVDRYEGIRNKSEKESSHDDAGTRSGR